MKKSSACVDISNQLLDNLNVQKRLHGDRWPEVMADLGTALQLHMKTTGETNAIIAALPIAKKMSEAGENPMIFIAVATELANAALCDPATKNLMSQSQDATPGSQQQQVVRPLLGLERICKLYGRMKFGATMMLWDYANECAVQEKEMPTGGKRWAMSEKAKWSNAELSAPKVMKLNGVQILNGVALNCYIEK